MTTHLFCKDNRDVGFHRVDVAVNSDLPGAVARALYVSTDDLDADQVKEVADVVAALQLPPHYFACDEFWMKLCSASTVVQFLEEKLHEMAEEKKYEDQRRYEAYTRALRAEDKLAVVRRAMSIMSGVEQPEKMSDGRLI